jgi:type I restriction enzyme S subunit
MSNLVEIKDLVETIIDNRGKTVPTSKIGIPLIATNCIKHESLYPTFEKLRYITQETYDTWFRAHIQPGDILFVNKGTPGRVCLVPDPADFVAAQDMVGLRFKNEFNPYYMLALLRSDHVQRTVQNNFVGLVIPHFRKQELVKMKLPVADRETRDKVGSFFKALSLKIELNRRINVELEQMARTLYDYWFVQFDFPDASGKPYKSSGGQMAYNDQLKREIPAGWQVQDMHANDLFEIIKPKIDKFAGTKQYIATADVNELTMTYGTPITYEGRESRANMQPREYTVWFAKMKESVKHIFVGDYSEDLLHYAIFSTGFMGMQTSIEAFEYLTLTIHRPYFELVKDANSNGATMAAIGNNDMKNIKLLVPNDRVLAQFHEIARPILEKMDRNRQESQKLAHLRDWLLPMLMNGQVKVGD